MAKSALLVVDMQEDFCPPVSRRTLLDTEERPAILTQCLKDGALAVAGGREIAPPINELLSIPFDLRIATRDFHPADHVSFSTAHPPPNNKAFESSADIVNPWNSSQSMSIPLWPPHCVQDTPGAEIIPEIDQSKLDRIIEKGRDKRVEMFSAFADAFGNKSSIAASFDLTAFLKGDGIGRVFVVGLAGDYCVRYTAVDARKEGFEVYVIEEAVKSIDNGAKGWGAAEDEFRKAGVHVVSIDGPEMQTIKLSSQ
ncbi:MAG: hypothetical protein Q9218_000367 [Villophora microphyllina]